MQRDSGTEMSQLSLYEQRMFLKAFWFSVSCVQILVTATDLLFKRFKGVTSLNKTEQNPGRHASAKTCIVLGDLIIYLIFSGWIMTHNNATTPKYTERAIMMSQQFSLLSPEITFPILNRMLCIQT